MTQQKPKLLIIEDDPGLQKQLRWSLDAYEVVVAGDREAALAQIRRHEPAVCTMDLGLPPDPDGSTEGLATLQQILALAPDTRVIVLTGNQDHANAVKAIGMGVGVFESREYVQELGGQLDVKSRQGEGTSFIITLPLNGQRAAQQQDEQQEESA